MTTKITTAGVKTLVSSTTATSDTHESSLMDGLQEFTDIIVTLDITAMALPDTYNFYITTGDGVSEWDIVHFPQIVSTTTVPIRYTAIVHGKEHPNNAETDTSFTLNTTTAGSSQGYGTLAADTVRHGPFCDRIGYYIKGANVHMSITYSITVTVKH